MVFFSQLLPDKVVSMAIVIVANGVHVQHSLAYLKAAAVVIAVDNGAAYCYAEKRKPDVLIGDLDSIEPDLLMRIQQDKVLIQQYPREKNHIDLELAVMYALAHYPPQEILIISTTGGRDDMHLANILLLAQPQFKDLDIKILGWQMMLQVVTPAKPFQAQLTPGQTLSLLPLSDVTQGITGGGLQYLLNDDTLALGCTRGLSNVVSQPQVTIRITQGTLLITYQATVFK
jgi:thiamine pyrophosphokinase